jgi:hypothetical protein
MNSNEEVVNLEGNELAKLPVKDNTKFQILNITIVDPNGQQHSLPLPMPYLFDKEDIPLLQIQNIQISEPKDIPGVQQPDFGFEEIRSDGSEQIQKEDSGEK